MTTVVWPHRTNPLLTLMNVSTAHNSQSNSASRPLRIVMAGGGTGGHLYPGLAVASALQARTGAAGQTLELLWAATPRPVDQRLLSGFGEKYIRQAVQPLTKSLKKLWPFWAAWRSTCAYWASQFASEQIDAVVALGGYAAGPASYIASKRRVPVVLLNPDALPGLANRFLLKRADVVIAQWPLAAEYVAKVKGEVKPLGCPIRPELTQRSRSDAVQRLGIDGSRRTLVITGASLGAKTINDAFLAFLETPLHRAVFSQDRAGWQIIHLAGMDQAETVRAAYAKYPDLAATVIDYCDDMASIWAVADLAIARAGASTCAELTACGVPSLLLPYPFHKDMHQRANAEELVRVGAAQIVDDAKDAARTAVAMTEPLKGLLYNDAQRTQMAVAAKNAGKPNAADEIAKEILALIGQSMR